MFQFMKKAFINLYLTMIATLWYSCAFCAQERVDKTYFKGYEVQFDYEGHQEERLKLYAFFLQNESFDFHPLEKDQIGIDFYDIDNDGQQEVLVYLANLDHCGALGCAFYIFKQDASSIYRNLWWDPNKTNDYIITTCEIKILDNKTRGFNDLVFYGFHFFKQIFNYSVWQWQGDHYMWQQSFEAPFPHEQEGWF